MNHKYLLTCISGGFGWGETGAKAEMCAENEEILKKHIPGGWIYEDLGLTNDTFYLNHLSTYRVTCEE